MFNITQIQNGLKMFQRAMTAREICAMHRYGVDGETVEAAQVFCREAVQNGELNEYSTDCGALVFTLRDVLLPC